MGHVWVCGAHVESVEFGFMVTIIPTVGTWLSPNNP